MTRAITTGGWTFLLLSTMYGRRCMRRDVLACAVGRATGLRSSACRPTASCLRRATVAASAPQPPRVAPSLLQQPAQEAQIVFADDSLSIHADNSSLAAILRQVAAKSGMKIDGLGGDERVFGSFGPGAPRDVLADLLDGTAYNLVLLGDLSNGAPRELILTPATRGGAAVPSPAPQVEADEASNEPESVELPPPPPPEQPPPGATPPPAPGVRTPQQLFEQLQRMRQARQQQPAARATACAAGRTAAVEHRSQTIRTIIVGAKMGTRGGESRGRS